MRRILISLVLAALVSGCAVTAVAGAIVETGATAAITGVKAGGAIADGAIDAVDEDDNPEDSEE